MSERPPAPGPAPRPVAQTPPPAALPWERYFPNLPPEAQLKLLRRAADQGGLCVRDLPAPPAAVAPPPPPLFARLLAAGPDALPAFDPTEVTDPDRPPAELHALSAALGCPDLFLVDAEPGPDRLAFAVELAAEAARAGERVLVLTGGSSEADAILARLADRPDLLAGRTLAGDEHPDRLPAASAGRTARAHGEGQLAQARARAADAVRDAERTLANLRSAARGLESLRPVADRLSRARAEEAAARGELAALAERVAGEIDTPLAVALREADDVHAATFARIDAEAQKAAAELTSKRVELDALKCPPKKRGLTGFLKGLFGDAGPGETAPRIPELEAAVQQLEATAARLAAERAAADDAHQADRDRRVREEVDRRRPAAAARAAELATQRETVEVEFRPLCAPLAAVGFTAADALTCDGLARTAAALAAAVAAAEEEAEFARGWAADLAAHGPELVRRLLGLVRVVVGPVAAFGHDRSLADAGFDRVVVTDADALGDPDPRTVPRLGSKWVLIGNAADPTVRGANGRGHRNGRPAPRPTLFRRLWGRMHRPSWIDDGGRLIALLQPCDTTALRGEPLADRPDIELRFGRDGAVLVEVAFPPHATAADAKAFLAGELGEVRLAPCGPATWHDAADRLTVCWPAAEARDPGDWVDLGDGVREKVVDGGPGGWTAAVAFDKAAGWDRDRAAAWLARHAAAPRTAALPRPVRFADPAPARALAEAYG